MFGNPQHPYTRMLLASVPRLHSRWSDAPAPAVLTRQSALTDVEPQPLVAVERGHFAAIGD